MNWTLLDSLATRPHTVLFSALANHWHLTPDHFDTVATVLNSHGWTVVDDRIPTPAPPSVPFSWDPPLVPGPLYRDRLHPPTTPPAFTPDLLTWLYLLPPEAHRYASPGFPYEDALQEGVFGLAYALERYDATRGVPFPRFARPYLRRFISRARQNQGSVIRIPHGQLELQSRVEQARWTLTPTLGHVPSAQELAIWLHLPCDRVEAVLALNDAPDSLDRPRFSEDDGTLLDTVPDGSAVDPSLPDDSPQVSEADALQWLLAHGFTLDTIAASTQRSLTDLTQLASDWMPEISAALAAVS